MALILNAQWSPRLQVFAEDNIDDQEPEQKQYWCAMCKNQLIYERKLEIWKCDACFEYFDTKTQDSVIKDKSDSKLVPYQN